jgi:hypothetical protein
MKELPYLKFNAAEWITGNITLEDFYTQGVFINICALYWFKSGCLETSEIKRRLKCKQATIDLLFNNGHIKSEGDHIKISFLDEQFVERGHISKINSQNAKKGGAPKGNSNAKKQENNNRTVDFEQPKTTNIEKNKNIEEENREDLDENFINWTKLIFEGGDQFFEQMLMNENFKLSAENFDFLCRDHLDLLSRYPKMQPNSQQKFRNSLMKHMRENHLKLAINGNGTNKKQQSNHSTATYLADYYSKKFSKQ